MSKFTIELTPYQRNTLRGAVKRDPSTGKPAYAPVIELDGRETRDAFSAAVIRALLEFNPRAFDTELVL